MDALFLRKFGTFFLSGQTLPAGDATLDGSVPYDPELLYVECRSCGKPIVWEKGRTTHILQQSDIDPQSVDSGCLILSDGCKKCKPGADPYHLSIVRLAAISPQDLILLQQHGGTA